MGFTRSRTSILASALLLALTSPIPTVAKGAVGSVALDAALDTPVVLVGDARHVYLRVALKGADIRAGLRRTPVNLAIVLDRSGSMSGDKIREAKEAAIMALERLGPDDIASVVTYESTVEVLVPATKLTDRDQIYAAIRRIQAGGSTALFAGVSKGAAELRKFLSAERVNRVILLSDGIANVGPSSPGDMAELGASLSREGIAVSTIGLGLDYNEDLMTRLAVESDGNHFFAENGSDLDRLFATELGEVTSVVAQDVDVTIEVPLPCRPVRVLGRDADIRGRRVIGRMNQLYAQQTKYFIIEIEVPKAAAGARLDVADVQVTMADTTHGMARRQLGQKVDCRYTAATAEAESAKNDLVVQSVVRQIGAEKTREAMLLRDQGKVEESRTLLIENAAYLQKSAEAYGNEYLLRDAEKAADDAKNLDEHNWKKQRKKMEADTFEQRQSTGYVE